MRFGMRPHVGIDVEVSFTTTSSECEFKTMVAEFWTRLLRPDVPATQLGMRTPDIGATLNVWSRVDEGTEVTLIVAGTVEPSAPLQAYRLAPPSALAVSTIAAIRPANLPAACQPGGTTDDVAGACRPAGVESPFTFTSDSQPRTSGTGMSRALPTYKTPAPPCRSHSTPCSRRCWPLSFGVGAPGA